MERGGLRVSGEEGEESEDVAMEEGEKTKPWCAYHRMLFLEQELWPRWRERETGR